MPHWASRQRHNVVPYFWLRSIYLGSWWQFWLHCSLYWCLNIYFTRTIRVWMIHLRQLFNVAYSMTPALVEKWVHWWMSWQNGWRNKYLFSRSPDKVQSLDGRLIDLSTSIYRQSEAVIISQQMKIDDRVGTKPQSTLARRGSNRWAYLQARNWCIGGICCLLLKR